MFSTLPSKREYEDIKARIKCGSCGTVFTVEQRNPKFKCPGCGIIPSEGSRNAVTDALIAFGDAEYRMEYDRHRGRSVFSLVDMQIVKDKGDNAQ